MHKSTDVCIVGGGFSGLNAAHYLEQHGISSLVLERNDRLAEKTKTEHVDQTAIDMCTCSASNDYNPVFEITDTLGVRRSTFAPSTYVSDYSIARDFYKTPLHGFVYILKNTGAILRYRDIWRDAVTRFDAGEPDARTSLSRPLADWLSEHGLSGLHPLIATFCDTYGYGPVDKIPAIYPLRFFTPSVLFAGIRKQYWRLHTFEDAIIRLGERVGAETETPVTGARFDHGTTTWHIDAGGGSISARHLVIACQPDTPVVLGIFEPERRDALSSGIAHGHYMSVAARIRNWYGQDRGVHLETADFHDKVAGSRRVSPLVDGVATYVCYASVTDRSKADPEAILRACTEREGADLQSVEHVMTFANYNTHFTDGAVRDGLYHTVLNSQGRDNLWLINACLAHENWRDLNALSASVADRIAGGAP